VKRDLRDGYAIRYAAVDDAVLLAQLARAGGSPYAAGLIAALAADRRVFMAEDEGSGHAVGLAAIGEIGGSLVVEALAVLPVARQRGIGSALLASVEELGRWALHPMVIAVARNARAGAFLAHRGYIAADPDRMPADLDRIGDGMPVLVKRL
jgi:N-acetylglutamate synthase-like GNAT family acetyltransferase